MFGKSRRGTVTMKVFFLNTWGLGWLGVSSRTKFFLKKSICTTDHFVIK